MKKIKAFTLAEVLLTLAVIGIVAAITLPSLLVDTTEKAFNAQRKALHARLAQAIGMMSSLSGYGQYVAEVKADDGSVTTPGKDNAAETFLYEGLSKVYKINNVCDSDNLDKCGIPASITTMAGSAMAFPKKISELNPQLIVNKEGVAANNLQTTDTKAAAFETVNGESIAVFYNPNCKSNIQPAATSASDWDGHFYTQNRMRVNFIYDLNGLKGPNKVGRDIGFITALYAKNPEVVAPVPLAYDGRYAEYTQQAAIQKCTEYGDDIRLPNKDELASIYFNKNVIGDIQIYSYWSSSVSTAEKAWNLNFNNGVRGRGPRTAKAVIRCIKK